MASIGVCGDGIGVSSDAFGDGVDVSFGVSGDGVDEFLVSLGMISNVSWGSVRSIFVIDCLGMILPGFCAVRSCFKSDGRSLPLDNFSVVAGQQDQP